MWLSLDLEAQMSSGEQEALKVADALDFVFRDGSIEVVQSAQRIIRRLVAEREADRAAMREAHQALDLMQLLFREDLKAVDPSKVEGVDAAISLLKERIE
jgi:hypothetical protein